MINNSAIDIAIGLFFIYALYSLLVTTITELVASWINLRGNILRNGLIRMLDNDTPQEAVIPVNNDNIEPASSNKYLDENLSQAFLDKPEIKYLGKRTRKGNNRFPSYLKPKTFAITLLDTIGYVYSNDIDLSAIKEKLNPKNETHKMIINLIDRADNNINQFKANAEEWYNETMERVSGWYKRRIQLITFLAGILIAFILNINTIEISKILGNDEKARLAMVEAASGYVKNLDETNPDVADKKSIDELNRDIKDLIQESKNVKSVMNVPRPGFGKHQNEVSWWSYIIGCMVTAVALSLGSPFWFDLLNKLIKLRSSGMQEKTNNSNPSKKSPVG